MKEQSRNPPDQTYEEEVGSLPEKEFGVMTVKMIEILEIEWRKYKKKRKKETTTTKLYNINYL